MEPLTESQQIAANNAKVESENRNKNLLKAGLWAAGIILGIYALSKII